MEIVIATKNLQKMHEFREISLFYPSLDILSLTSFPQFHPLTPKKNTFAENALLKAKDAAETLNKWVIADDSGLVIPALKGEEGALNRRYHSQMNDPSAIKELLQLMENKKELERAAYLHCSLALVSPNGVEKVVSSITEGFIAEEARGSNGISYETVFIKHDYEKTLAQLDDSIRNRISCRRKTFDKLMMGIESLQYQAVNQQ